MFIFEGFFAVEMGKTEIKMNKPVYLGQAILDLLMIVRPACLTVRRNTESNCCFEMRNKRCTRQISI